MQQLSRVFFKDPKPWLTARLGILPFCTFSVNLQKPSLLWRKRMFVCLYNGIQQNLEEILYLGLADSNREHKEYVW